MIPAPTITVNGARINSTASAYQTAPTAVAPLSITWGRNNLIGHTSPATATINIDIPPRTLITNHAPLGAPVVIADGETGDPYFCGTVRALEVSGPTSPGGHAHAKVTATDWTTSLKGARLSVIPGASYESILPAHGGGQWAAAYQESARMRITRFVRAVHPGATIDMPSGLYSADATTMFTAPMRELGHKVPNLFSSDAWKNIVRTLTGAASTIHHTPTVDNAATWTVVPWGEGVPALMNTILAARLNGDITAKTSISARTDLIEATYWHIVNGSADRYDPKPLYRSRTLHTNPQTSTRLESDLSAYQQTPGGAKTDLTHVDRLLARTQAILGANTWNLSNFIPRITTGKQGSASDILARQLLTPTTRCRISLTLTGLPVWLGVGIYTRVNPLGGTNRWDGKRWTIELNCARQVF